jgi:hypothetical protein
LTFNTAAIYADELLPSYLLWELKENLVSLSRTGMDKDGISSKMQEKDGLLKSYFLPSNVFWEKTYYQKKFVHRK